MMKWYYLWKLRQANKRLNAALAAVRSMRVTRRFSVSVSGYPSAFFASPQERVVEIAELACAYKEVNLWLKKLS